MRLNGWQRLWVVFATIYLIAVLSFAYFDMPTENDIYNEWALETIEFVIEYDDKLNGLYPSVVKRKYKDISDKELISKIQNKYIEINVFNKFDFDNIDEKYQHQLNQITSNQVKYFGNALLIWALPSVTLYIVGLSISWVRRGFKQA